MYNSIWSDAYVETENEVLINEIKKFKNIIPNKILTVNIKLTGITINFSKKATHKTAGIKSIKIINILAAKTLLKYSLASFVLFWLLTDRQRNKVIVYEG